MNTRFLASVIGLQLVIIVFLILNTTLGGEARQERWNALDTRYRSTKAEYDAYKESAERREAALQERNEKLQAELNEYNTALAEVQRESSSARQQLQQAEAALSELDEAPEGEGEGADEEVAAENDEEDNDRGRSRWGNMSDEERHEMAQRFQDDMNAFFDDEIAYAQTDVERERLTLLANSANEMFALRDKMRNAETEEERDAAREEFRVVMDEMRSLRQEQQRSMLRDLGRAYGVKGKGNMRQFLDDMEATLDTPYFRYGPPGGDRGRGGRDRGED